MSNSTAVDLTALLASPTATLVYAIPLLIVSVVLTFAGTFLTLDRSRSFPPRHDKTDKIIYSSYESFEKRGSRQWLWWWRLEGGVGGLVEGYVFGVHLATFLALMVPNISTSESLSPTAFLAVCIMSAVLSCALSGRYKIVTIVFAGISGGALSSLALSVMLHPSLTGRRILLVILTILVSIPTVFICTILPRILVTESNTCLAYLQHLVRPLLRFCTASTGSFGLLVSIALLLKPPAKSWANVFERLWVSDGVGWGTSQEKGLTAAWAFFTFFGIVGDWALRSWFGEDPDEKWDDYLSSYVESLPFSSHRAGTFKPLPSLWDRLFHRQPPLRRSFKDGPGLAYLDAKSKSLLTEDLSPPSSPLLKSTIPDPFYADTPPPLSHLPKPRHLVNANYRPGAKPSIPPSDTEDDGASDDSDDYDLPPLLKKRRKHGRFAKFRLRLRNPDGKATHPADPVGFRPLAQRDNDSDSDENKKRGPSDDGVTTMSSATLVGSGGNRPSQNSDAHGAPSRRFPAGADPAERMENGGVEPRSTAREPMPEYPDYEVDLTSMAPSPRGLNGGRLRVQVDKVPRLVERHISSPKPQTPVSDSPSTVPGTPESPSATDRARARVRAIVAGVPTRPSRRGSLAQMPQLPKSPPPLYHGPPHNEGQSPTLSPVTFPAPVPATPSLLNALHRVAVAQQQACGAHAVSHYGVDGLPGSPAGDASGSSQGGLPEMGSSPKGLRKPKRGSSEVDRVDGWDDFWSDVKAQARVPIR
ncbi:hypothetical protein AX14_002814 [Amanita brunnescens Koide BX004]|nr:hypothetical protein AX14_002814 [Amanita brunnescens Koide BX004]